MGRKSKNPKNKASQTNTSGPIVTPVDHLQKDFSAAESIARNIAQQNGGNPLMGEVVSGLESIKGLLPAVSSDMKDSSAELLNKMKSILKETELVNKSIIDMKNQAEKARNDAVKERETLKKERSKLNEESRKFKEDIEQKQDAIEKEFAERKKTFDLNEEALMEAKRKINDREEALLRREIEAEAGFPDLHHEMLQRLRQTEDEISKNIEIQLQEYMREREKMCASFANKENEIREREALLIEKEAQADAEFPEKQRTVLATLENKIEKYANELQKLILEISNERVVWSGEKIKIHDQIQAQLKVQLQSKEKEIEIKEKTLSDREIQLSNKSRELEYKESNLAGEQKILKEYKFQLEKDLRNEYEEKLSNLKDEIRSQNQVIISLQNQIKEFTSIRTYLGDRSPEEVMSLLEELRNDKNTLQIQLDKSGGPELQNRYDLIKQELQEKEDQLFEKQRMLNETKTKLLKYETAQLEIENLRNQKEAIEVHRDALNTAVDQLRNEIGELKERDANKQVFAEFSKIDLSCSRSQSRRGRESACTLRDFVEGLGAAMQYTDNRYYYSREILQLFVGGLAMSRLVILQGISGTGKTSLVKLFSKYVGGEETCQDIAVQSGWRDSQDLLGYYNAFEKKFYEKDFSIGLYKAASERFKNEPFFILLDEMNLSHPEQYFADFLSELEKEDKSDVLKVRLVSGLSPRGDWPKFLYEQEYLKIPKNVWFIGTANHDETTMEFAGKTYDRSHVMTLPRHQSDFESYDKNKMDACRWTFNDLKTAFTEAQNRFSNETSKIKSILQNEKLRDILDNKFDTGWGNRLDRQIEKFVPVVCAAGGSAGLALDHVLATKILRKGKVTGRFDTARGDLEELKVVVEEMLNCSKFQTAEELSQSVRILANDIRRKESGNV